MSTIQANAILDASGGNTVTVNGVTPNSEVLKGRNLIINGAMQVAQRGTSFTVTNEYGIDRWFCRENTDGALTFSQDSESPAGFSKSIKVNVDTADTSLTSSQFAYLAQRIEGYNIEPLAFGSSDAKTVTLSFYVRCSVTGKFGGAITNGSNNNRSYAFTYDVNSANTWERKTITITGDTTGTWNIDNTQQMAVFLSLGGGSGVKKAEGSWDATSGVQSATEANTELVENASATWYVTGVKLEVGSVATEFDHRSYGEELSLCQRYFYSMDRAGSSSNQVIGQGYWATSTIVETYTSYPVTMRTSPTVSADTIGDFYALIPQTAWNQASNLSANEVGPNGAKLAWTCSSNGSFSSDGRRDSHLGIRGDDGLLKFDAEL